MNRHFQFCIDNRQCPFFKFTIDISVSDQLQAVISEAYKTRLLLTVTIRAGNFLPKRSKIDFLRRIRNYSTSSTSDAAYIIGGIYTRDIIAEFKNDAWRQLGTLEKGRNTHGSIILNDETMVIGGYSSDNRLAYFYY